MHAELQPAARWYGLLLAAFCAVSAYAQEPPGGAPIEGLGLPEPGALEPEREVVPERDPALEVPRPDGAVPAPGGTGPRLLVQEFEFRGHSVFDTATLRDAVAQWTGSELGDTELQAARARIIALYREAGYLTSTAQYPDQDLSGGVVLMQVIEGRLAAVEVSGARSFDPDFIAAQLAPADRSAPLNVRELEARMRRLLRDPLLRDIDARLRPAAPGAAVLEARIEEGRRFSAALDFGNDRSPAIGGEYWQLGGSARNLFGRGDSLRLALGGTGAGLHQLEAGVQLPLDSAGTALYASFENYDARIVEEPLDALAIETRSRSWEAGLSRPLWRGAAHEIEAGLGLGFRDSRSFLNGVPFSFSPGAVRGHAQIAALRGVLRWNWRGRDQVLLARLGLNGGLDAFGSTVHADQRPDSEFFTAQAELQWLRRVGPGGGQLLARFNLQLSDDALLPVERFALGGRYAVRGYRRALLVRDNAWVAALEYRLPLLRLPLPGVSRDAADGQLSLIAFADLGRAWNDVNPDGVLNRLWSVGPGLRWDAAPGLRAEMYWGALRRHLRQAGDDLQDDGVHFQLSLRTDR